MYAKYMKRLLDILLSLTILIVLSPLLLVLCILVRSKLGSPIFFQQERPGLHEKIFTMYKFRTMTDKRDAEGNLLPDKDRLTKFGKLLRATSLDELPEFSRESLEVLRQPLEDGQITVSRAAGSATYPSHFQLVAAMNPCKCGYYGHPTRACTCSPSAVRQYRSRVSGPLLDRIDLCVEMDPIAFDELHTAAPSESSAELRKQVLAARAIQAKRYAAPGFKGVHCNAQLNAGQVRRICRMTPGAEQLLRSSYDALGLSARAHDRILRVARTVADLAGKTLLDEDSLLEALQYRAQEKLDG